MTPWNPAQFEALMAFNDAGTIKLIRLQRTGPGQVLAINGGALSLSSGTSISQYNRFVVAGDQDTFAWRLLSFAGDTLIEELPPTGYESLGSVGFAKDYVRINDAYVIRSGAGGHHFYNLRTDADTFIASASPGVATPAKVWGGKAFSLDAFSAIHVYDIDAGTSQSVSFLGAGTDPLTSSGIPSLAFAAAPLQVYGSVSVIGGGSMQAPVNTYEAGVLSDEVVTGFSAIMPSYSDFSSIAGVAGGQGVLYSQYRRSDTDSKNRLVLLRNDGTEIVVGPKQDGFSVGLGSSSAQDFYGNANWFGIGYFDDGFLWQLVESDLSRSGLYAALTNGGSDALFSNIATGEFGVGRVYAGPDNTIPDPPPPFWTDFNRTRERRFA